jgi:class 3 adenylate cyclase/pimeloyl-ACP methyl ester carboxylesterase
MERRLAAILAIDVVGFSRLMELDEQGTYERLSKLRAQIFQPTVEAHKGRIVKMMGDGALVEFASAVNAAFCAQELLRQVVEVNRGIEEAKAIRFRIGLHLGEVIVEGGDIFGDGVNIAARLESLAEADSILLSEDFARQVRGKLKEPLKDLGERNLKNISQPLRVFSLGVTGEERRPEEARFRQDIRYCRAHDGTRIAYSTVGQGPPIVKAANWLNHLELDWDSPIWNPLFLELARDNQLVRYDERGNGLSDWEVDDLSFEAFIDDLEVVVDAAGLERFVLLGISQGSAVSIAYAARHPEKVAGLILYGGYPLGWRNRSDGDELKRREAMQELITIGWGQDNPAFRQVFTSLYIPRAGEKEREWFNELQRQTTTPENAARIQDAIGRIDVRDLLSKVSQPTLVLHSRKDMVTPLEMGREIAKGIPGARFVTLESDNHVLLENEPALADFLAEVKGFLKEVDF